MQNRKWILTSYAEREPDDSTWTLVQAEMPTPGTGQILVKNRWLSMDPYLRGRLNPPVNGVATMKIGDQMGGGGVGEVIQSNHPAWKIGDFAEGLEVGWQEYAVLTPELPGPARINKVDLSVAPPQAALSWLGMTGLTAYFGMLDLGRPRPGDVVVVSAASGAVGQIAGQIAKMAGCRVIGIAGSDDKLDYCRGIGFDDGINYKTAPDLTAAVAKACPQGVNVFYDNTGGPIHDAVMMNLAIGARVVICGRIAMANKVGEPDIGLRASSRMIATRAVLQGLAVFDYWHRRDEAIKRLVAWQSSGALQFREDVVEGFENAPHAFIRMMRGDNFGKQLVRI